MSGRKRKTISDEESDNDYKILDASIVHIEGMILKQWTESEVRGKRWHTKAIQSLDALRQHLNARLDTLEMTVETIMKRKRNAIADISAKCLNQVETMRLRLSALRETETDFQLLVKKQQLQRYIDDLEDGVKELYRVARISVSKDVQSFTQGFNSLGKLIKDCQSSSLKASHVTDIHVVAASDTLACQIIGSVILPNDDLMIVDYNNDKIKRINTKENRIVSELKVWGGMGDIAVVNTDEFVVTMPACNKIAFVRSFGKRMNVVKRLNVEGKCHGIAYLSYANIFVVTFINPGKVETIDKQGLIYRKFEVDEYGESLFDSPWYVTQSLRNEARFHISDNRRCRILSLTLDGRIHTIHTSPALKLPEKLVTDENGNIYSVGNVHHNIVVFEYGVEEGRELLTFADGIPQSVSYCARSRQLFVGMQHTNIVRVYQL